MKRTKDPFSNPVGQALSRGAEAIYGTVLEWNEGAAPERLAAHLEGIIKIRAIQEFTPSQAVAFVFGLKTAVREELGSKLQASDSVDDLEELDSQIDQMALVAFDVFVKCREKLYELRLNEIKRTGYRLLRKYDLIADDTDQDGDSPQFHV